MPKEEEGRNSFGTREPVEVTLGKPFKIAPRFRSIQQRDLDEDADVVLDKIPLIIEREGKGTIGVLISPEILRGEGGLPVRVPTEEIRATTIYRDGGPRVDLKDAPVELNIHLEGLPQHILESLRFEIVYEDKTYLADLFIDKGYDPQNPNRDFDIVTHISYIDLNDQKECYVILPQDQQVFDKLQLILSSNPDTHLKRFMELK